MTTNCLFSIPRLIANLPHVRFCTVVVQYLESGDGDEEQMSDLQSEKYTQEVLRTVFSGMHTLLKAALRQPGLKAEVWCNRAVRFE